MATYQTGRFSIQQGNCPTDEVTVTLTSAGGGSDLLKYYVNWYTPDPGNTNNAAVPYLCGFPFGKTKHCQIEVKAGSYNLWAHTEFGIAQTYPLTANQNTVVQDIIANLAVVTSRVITTHTEPSSSSIFIDVYMDNTDPAYTATQYTFTYTKESNPYNYVDVGETCPGTNTVLKPITDWKFLAGGYYHMSVTVPCGTKLLIEVTDEVLRTDSVTIDTQCVEELPCPSEVKDVTCHGGNDGSITMGDFHDDSGSLSFEWKNSNLDIISTDKDIRNLVADTYCLKVTNAKGCTKTCCVTVHEPDELLIVIEDQKNPTCIACNTPDRFGTVLFSVTGGNTECKECNVSPYEYSLDNASWIKLDFDNTKLLTNLLAGKHLLKVKDCSCCITTVVLDITQTDINVDI